MHLNWRRLGQIPANKKNQLLNLLNTASEANLDEFVQQMNIRANNPQRKERVLKNIVNNDDLTVGLSRFNINVLNKIASLIREDIFISFLNSYDRRIAYLNGVQDIDFIRRYLENCRNADDLIRVNVPFKDTIINGMRSDKLKELILTLPIAQQQNIIHRLTKVSFYGFYQALNIGEQATFAPLFTAQQQQWIVNRQAEIDDALDALRD